MIDYDKFKPMLACSEIPAIEDLKYPVMLSPKLDGIRAICVPGKDLPMISRNKKNIPNNFIQVKMRLIATFLKEQGLEGYLDGELMVKGDFNNVQSAVMSWSGSPDFEYHVFDYVEPKLTAKQRSNKLKKIVAEINEDWRWSGSARTKGTIHVVPQHLAADFETADFFLDSFIAAGYEGAMVKSFDGQYKFGRSTMKQGLLLKLKKFYDDEAAINDIVPLMRNADTSCHRLENLVETELLGAFQVKYKGLIFNIGTGKGLTEAKRAELWAARKELIGKTLTFTYQELSKYGVPRFPSFKAIREPE